MNAEEYLESMEAGGGANISLREIITELFYHCDAYSWRDYEISFVTGVSISLVEAELEAMEKTGEAVRCEDEEGEEDEDFSGFRGLCNECRTKLEEIRKSGVEINEDIIDGLMCSECVKHFAKYEKNEEMK